MGCAQSSVRAGHPPTPLFWKTKNQLKTLPDRPAFFWTYPLKH